MRIVTAIYGQARGGSERAVMRLIREWRAAGHDVHCVGEHADGSARPLTLAKQIVEACSAAPSDILFAPGQTYALPFALVRIRTRHAPPLVTKISNMPEPGLRGAPGRSWLAQQRRWTHRFVAPDELSQRALSGWVPAFSPKLVAIANPAADQNHLQALHDAGISKTEGLHLLSIGRLVRQKNFARLIRAFAQIQGSADRLTILGEGPERENLTALVRQLSANVDLVGYQSDISPWITRANAFASSSDFEGLPAVLVEALAAGLPIAATQSSPAIPALLGDDERGIVVPGRDVAALASALTRLREFQPCRMQMYDMACNFTAERSAPAYVRLFERLANSAGDAKAS